MQGEVTLSTSGSNSSTPDDLNLKRSEPPVCSHTPASYDASDFYNFGATTDTYMPLTVREDDVKPGTVSMFICLTHLMEK